MLGHDVAGVFIRVMVIIFDALGASNELGKKVPETAEAWSSLNFMDRPYGRPDIFCTVFHHVSSFAQEPCNSTVMVTLRNRDLQEWCILTLYFYCPTAFYRPYFVLCPPLLHGNHVVLPLW